MPVTPADSNAASEMDQDDKASSTIPDSYFAKYNVKVPRPRYSEEEYETHMKNEDWSREETDYLVDLAIDYDLRWIVISDRYDYRPNEGKEGDANAMVAVSSPTARTQEALKSRYYTIAGKAMALRIPVEQMSSSEFETHERMLKYNPSQETQRKKYAEQLLSRTDEEKHEEELLLKELSRIVLNQEKLFNERKALYERLDAPKTTPNEHSTTTMYQTSSGLTHLMQNLVNQSKTRELEKKQKRQSALGAEEPTQNPAERQRQSLDNSTAPNKRSSLGASAQSHQRHLSARDQLRYGVSYPTNERLVGGVSFRNERATKAAQAKSSVQTTRISQALSELRIPLRLMMPTTKVVSEYEKLIESVKGLLEVRKLSEKVDGEIKVWRAQKEQAEAKARGEDITQRRGSREASNNAAKQMDGSADRLEKDTANSSSNVNGTAGNNTSKAQDQRVKNEVGSPDGEEDSKIDLSGNQDEDTKMTDADKEGETRIEEDNTNEPRAEAAMEDDDEEEEDQHYASNTNQRNSKQQEQDEEEAADEDDEDDEDQDDEENGAENGEDEEEDETANDITVEDPDDDDDDDDDNGLDNADIEADAEVEAEMQGDDADVRLDDGDGVEEDEDEEEEEEEEQVEVDLDHDDEDEEGEEENDNAVQNDGDDEDGERDGDVDGEDGIEAVEADANGDGEDEDDQVEVEDEDEANPDLDIDADVENPDSQAEGEAEGDELGNNDDGGGDDDDGLNGAGDEGEPDEETADSKATAAAANAKSRGARKRSASVISAVSNKSSKKQRK